MFFLLCGEGLLVVYFLVLGLIFVEGLGKGVVYF